MFRINPALGAKVEDAKFSNLPQSGWNNGILSADDLGNNKYYDISYLYYNNDLYMKGNKKYKCALFEQIFGFNYDCSNFDENKAIKIKL